MIELAPGWPLTVERGPDWLFIRLEHCEPDAPAEPPLAECIWNLTRQHFVHRVVLELDQVERLQSHLIGQLVLLHKRIYSQGGILRVCGLSPQNEQVLALARLSERFMNFANREEAMAGYHPVLPR